MKWGTTIQINKLPFFFFFLFQGASCLPLRKTQNAIHVTILKSAIYFCFTFVLAFLFVFVVLDFFHPQK